LGHAGGFATNPAVKIPCRKNYRCQKALQLAGQSKRWMICGALNTPPKPPFPGRHSPADDDGIGDDATTLPGRIVTVGT